MHAERIKKRPIYCICHCLYIKQLNILTLEMSVHLYYLLLQQTTDISPHYESNNYELVNILNQ